MIVCSRCGHESPDEARFCASCGTALAAVVRREERKVVTVVFADLVGSTARAEHADPEDVRAVLAPYHARLRQELEHFGGTVEKFIGDAVVAVFGAPVVHEDDPERAVRAALAIQGAISELNEADPELELQVRVGVNTGEALVALDASPAEGEGMVSGDVINTGARLQGAAPPGGVLVGDATYRATDRVIEYEPADAIVAKGKAEPVTAWRAIAPRASFGVDLGGAGRAPLVGREREATLLTTALERVRAEREPQLITLVGVPGIGKSRLVQELSRVVDEDPDLITWRQGRSLPYGEGVAYWALGEMVKAQTGILESATSDEAADRLALSMAELMEDDGERAWVERHLRPLVGLVSEHGAGEMAAEAAAAWRRFFEALADARPTVLVFEDLHWADDGLLDFVDELADRVAGVPLLVVASARPELLERRPGWGGGKRNAQTVSLTPLTDDDTARLLQTLLDRSVISAEVQAELLRNAGGIPLYAEEYVRMVESGGATGGVPETLQGVVTARLDGLPDDEKLLLHSAAVLGKVFWTDALAALVPGEPWLLDDRLHALERKEFVRRERRSAVEGARQYVFVHALVRDASYAQMPRAERSLRHRAAAEWILALSPDRSQDRAEMLVHHLLQAIELGEAAGLEVGDLRAPAVDALVEAGSRTWVLAAPESSARFYRHAIEVTGGDEPDPKLLYLHGRAVAWNGSAEAAPILEQAVEMSLARGDRITAALALVDLYQGRWVRGEDVDPSALRQALELVEDAPESIDRARVLGAVGRFYGLSGRSVDALPLDESALATARRLGDRQFEAWTLNNRGVARTNAGDIDGLDDIRAALQIAEELGSGDVLRCHTNLGSILASLGRLEEAREYHRLGHDQARQREHPSEQRWLASELVLDAYWAGDWEEATRSGQALLERSDDAAHYMDQVVTQALLEIELARTGTLRDEDVRGLLDVARRVRDPQALLPVLGATARNGRLLGWSATEVESLVDEFIEAISGAQTLIGFDPYACVVAAEGYRSAEIVAELAGRPRTAWTPAIEAEAAGDPAAAAEALAIVRDRPDEADARLRAATLLAAAGRTSDAARQAEQAAGFYRSVQAIARLVEAERLLAALGERGAVS